MIDKKLVDNLLKAAEKVLETKTIESCTNYEAFVVGFVMGAYLMIEKEEDNDK